MTINYIYIYTEQHEHLGSFGIINMNGRIYNPNTASFFSPDPYVSSPYSTQAFNRYSYCVNNPLMYTDPSGEWFGIDDLVIAGIGFTIGYVQHGLTTGNWGWKAVAAGGIEAAMAWIGYNTCGLSSATAGQGITSATWSYAGNMAINTASNALFKPMTIQIGNNFSISASWGFGLGPDGLIPGVNFSGAYTDGDVTLSGGLGASGNMSSWGAGLSYKGYGVSYYSTTYGGANAQTVGGIGIRVNDVSLRIENDFFVSGGFDRGRTSAVELGIGKYVIGKSVYTNDPGPEEYRKDRTDVYTSSIYGNGEAYKDGEVLNSYLYIGTTHNGKVTRLGINRPWVQDATQNGFHKLIGIPFFKTPYGKYTGGFFYKGYYNPYSLYGR